MRKGINATRFAPYDRRAFGLRNCLNARRERGYSTPIEMARMQVLVHRILLDIANHFRMNVKK